MINEPFYLFELAFFTKVSGNGNGDPEIGLITAEVEQMSSLSFLHSETPSELMSRFMTKNWCLP